MDTDKMLVDLKDLRFTFTDEMKDLTIKMLYIKQMLDDEESDLTKKDKKLLEKEFDNLLKKFRVEFQAYNQVQVQIVRAYLSGK